MLPSALRLTARCRISSHASRRSVCRVPSWNQPFLSSMHAPHHATTAKRMRVPAGMQAHRQSDEAPDHRGSPLAWTINREITSSETVPELEQVVDNWIDSLGAINTAAAIVKAAKLGRKQSQAAKSLAGRLLTTWDQALPKADARALANVLWAAGQLHVMDERFWNETLQQVMQQRKLSAAKLQELANVVHGLATMSGASGGQVPGLSKEDVAAAVTAVLEECYIAVTHPLLQDIDPQGISNILWAYSKLDVCPQQRVLSAMLVAFTKPKLLGDAAPQAIANVLISTSYFLRAREWIAAGRRFQGASVGATVWRLPAQEGSKSWTTQRHSDVMIALEKYSSGDLQLTPLSRKVARECAVLALVGQIAQQPKTWNKLDVSSCRLACERLGVPFEQYVHVNLVVRYAEECHSSAGRWAKTFAGWQHRQSSCPCEMSCLQLQLGSLPWHSKYSLYCTGPAPCAAAAHSEMPLLLSKMLNFASTLGGSIAHMFMELVQ